MAPKDEKEELQLTWSLLLGERSKNQSPKNEVKPLDRGWRNVRVFVSSTFVDMHFERETLVQRVFPSLRVWMATQKLRLYDVDLRWGVPKETPADQTIQICLSEIDRCIEENSDVFFVCLLGNRYGWVPEVGDVSQESRQRWAWVPGFSVTSMEIVHAVLRSGNNPNALFMMRDISFLKAPEGDVLKGFNSPTELDKFKMATLRSKIEETFPSQCSHYAPIPRIEVGKLAGLDGLDDFGDKVFTFLKESIQRSYPISANPDPWRSQDQDHQHAMLHLKSAVGRENTLHHIKLKIWQGESPKPIVVAGAKSCGYDELVLQVTQEPEAAQTKVFCHVASITQFANSSSSVLNVLQRLWKMLASGIGVEAEPPDNIHTLVPQIQQQLVHWSNMIQSGASEHKVLLIVICGVDILCEEGKMYWLPDVIPPHITVCVSGSLTSVAIQELEGSGCDVIRLGSIPMEGRRAVLKETFARFNKQLDPGQQTKLLANPASEHQVWLTLVCEELRQSAVFETVDTMIDSFPPSIPELISQVLRNRVSKSPVFGAMGLNLAEAALCVLVCSPASLLHTDVKTVLACASADNLVHQDLPAAIWAEVLSCIDISLTGLLGKILLKSAFVDTARVLFLQNNSEKWVNLLVQHFSKSPTIDIERKVENLSKIFLSAKRYQELMKCLLDINFFSCLFGTSLSDLSSMWATLIEEKILKADDGSSIHASLLRVYQDALGKFDVALKSQSDASDNVVAAKVADATSSVAEFLRSMGVQNLGDMYHANLSRRRGLGQGKTATYASDLLQLAILKQSQNSFEEAEPLFQQSLAIRQDIYGAEHTLVARSANYLGLMYKNWKKLDQAEIFCGQGLQIRRKLYGKLHVDVTYSLNGMAAMLLEGKQFARAEELFKESLEILANVMGPEHSDNVYPLQRCADVCLEQGRKRDALKYYTRAHFIGCKTNGAAHPRMMVLQEKISQLNGELDHALIMPEQQRLELYGAITAKQQELVGENQDLDSLLESLSRCLTPASLRRTADIVRGMDSGSDEAAAIWNGSLGAQELCYLLAYFHVLKQHRPLVQLDACVALTYTLEKSGRGGWKAYSCMPLEFSFLELPPCPDLMFTQPPEMYKPRFITRPTGPYLCGGRDVGSLKFFSLVTNRSFDLDTVERDAVVTMLGLQGYAKVKEDFAVVQIDGKVSQNLAKPAMIWIYKTLADAPSSKWLVGDNFLHESVPGFTSAGHPEVLGVTFELPAANFEELRVNGLKIRIFPKV